MRPPSSPLQTRWGYHDWRFTRLCGPTPGFAWAGLRAVADRAAPEGAAAQVWACAQAVLVQLSHAHPALSPWARCVQQLGDLPPHAHPLEFGWQALQAACGLREYPSKVQVTAGSAPEAEDSPPWRSLQVTLHTACPYGEFAVRGLQLVGLWLGWGEAALEQGRLDVDRNLFKQWCEAVDGLVPLLPPAPLPALHHRLGQAGIDWEWLGGERTRVGCGARQQVVQGLPLETPSRPLDDADHWRIPIYTVTGSVGKTTTVRLLWQLLQDSGQCLALTASDGAWMGTRQVAQGDCIGGFGAQAMLRSPEVEAAVFEQGRGGMLKQGVPYAHSDVAVLLNVQAVHLGLDGIETLAHMADTKALGLRPARVVVLNHDDAECRRLGEMWPAPRKVWFSVQAALPALQALSHAALGVLGVARHADGTPEALVLCQRGATQARWSLGGVAPYHGMLGEKTLEELLAAVAAAWFGPLPLSRNGWPDRLRRLRLDEHNHAFRTSVHRQGKAVFVLDKAAEISSLQALEAALVQLAAREGCQHRIVALARSASEPPARHLESAERLYRFMDEFVCFDRPETYTSTVALPIYQAGDLPRLVGDALHRLNAAHGTNKPVTVLPGWREAETYLRERLQALPGKTLVLLNQPSTAATALNAQIQAFAIDGLRKKPSTAGDVAKPSERP